MQKLTQGHIRAMAKADLLIFGMPTGNGSDVKRLAECPYISEKQVRQSLMNYRIKHRGEKVGLYGFVKRKLKKRWWERLFRRPHRTEDIFFEIIEPKAL